MKRPQGERGWDHDQGRLWPGFHRHCRDGHARLQFSGRLEWPRRSQLCRGRPRAPFSPSAGSSEALVASGPSRDRAVAAPPSRPLVGHNRSVQGTLLTKDLTEQY